MALDPDAVRRIALLARIAVTDSEVAALQGELNSILGMIERMQGVNTAGIVPMAHAFEMHTPLRDDQVTETDQRAEFQAGAPAVQDGLYLVPRVIE